MTREPPHGSLALRAKAPPIVHLARSSGLGSLDALHCQKSTAREIQEADADYGLALKGNQGTAHGEARAILDDAILRTAPTLVKMETVEKGHGRIETRRYWQSGDIGWFADRAEWGNLRSAGVVEAVRKVTGSAPSTERRYYLSSLPPDIAKFARAVHSHWAVENQLHWSLDVSFDEDRSRARTRHAATDLATLRRITLNLLRAEKTSSKTSIENASAALSIQTTSHRSSNFDAPALNGCLCLLLKVRIHWISHGAE